jgi:hypothetical protein
VQQVEEAIGEYQRLPEFDNFLPAGCCLVESEYVCQKDLLAFRGFRVFHGSRNNVNHEKHEGHENLLLDHFYPEQRL